jgi:hypothetical protein
VCFSRKDGLGLVEVLGEMVYNQGFVWNWVNNAKFKRSVSGIGCQKASGGAASGIDESG